MRIAVIADDLTGALDTGVQFSKWGFTVQVTDDPTSSEAQVVVVDTDSREISPEEAYRLVFNVASKLNGFDIIYKKIDSTMRGNICVELRAVMDATGETKAILTPCYPPTGRSVKDGYLLVNGVPVGETAYHPSSSTSLISDIIGDDLDGVHVYDSETESDLLEIATRFNDRIIVGSAGLAAALAESLVKPPPVLSVIGSTRTLSRDQVGEYSKRLNAKVIPIDTKAMLQGGNQDKVVSEALKALTSGQDVIIVSAPSEKSVSELVELAEKSGTKELETLITSTLASITEKLLMGCSVSGLLLSGGATAKAVCEAISISEISIIEELRPGIPLLSLGEINAVTKAGGFGELDALVQSAQYLKRKFK